MKPWEKTTVNEKGHMVFGGCDMVELAGIYGTPLYVLDEQYVRSVCRGFVGTLQKCGARGRVLYASKALCTSALYRIVAQEGLGADVVSGGELYTALEAGFPADRIYLHGNNKTPQEIRMALEADIACLVVDSHEEIGLIASIARELGKTARVSLRTKPGIEAHTHEYIMTAKEDCKFGLGLYDGEAEKAVREILAHPELELTGIHCHIGSQIFELEPFLIATDRLTDFAVELRDRFGVTISEINFGGGYGITYTDGDAAMEPYDYVEAMIENLHAQCDKKGLPRLGFVIEPGRSIVGEAGLTLYTVGTVKHIPNVRTYVSVDGGMGDNPRQILYGSVYTSRLANKPEAPAAESVTVAGRCCESGDVLIKEAPLPPCEAGDILAVFSTGAYNYSMASNYNRVPVPAMALVSNGKHGLIVRRQSYEQLVENDLTPDWID